ncbi:MAG: sugar phosphate isomerase/epimerase [Chloroflexi bacterium]|nr:sugar phosphate isomerase/epimerase [Chloroflexota bacterium]
MRLGLHTYSLYHHGIAEDWAGFKLPWPRQMDIWQLMDYVVSIGLEGIHLDDKAFHSMDEAHFHNVRDYAAERNLYLEYNFAMPSDKYDGNVQHEIEDGIAIAKAIGADVAKLGMNLTRPHPVAASKFHPEVMVQLENVVAKLKRAVPLAQDAGVRIGVENHTDAFSDEALWVLDQVDHPAVGACVDTVNALHVTENPITAVANLAPRAVTNHFRDAKIIIQPDGFKLTGVVVGDGDLDMKRAYELIKQNPNVNRLNVELDLKCPLDDMRETLQIEREALEKSVAFCREELGI